MPSQSGLVQAEVATSSPCCAGRASWAAGAQRAGVPMREERNVTSRMSSPRPGGCSDANRSKPTSCALTGMRNSFANSTNPASMRRMFALAKPAGRASFCISAQSVRCMFLRRHDLKPSLAGIAEPTHAAIDAANLSRGVVKIELGLPARRAASRHSQAAQGTRTLQRKYRGLVGEVGRAAIAGGFDEIPGHPRSGRS